MDLDFTGLAQHLLGRADSFVDLLLPGGKRVGKEYTCANINGGKGRSFSVNLQTGAWGEFNVADGKSGGDLISLYAYKHGMKNGEAAKRLALEYHYDLTKNAPKSVRKGDIVPLVPPPEHQNTIPNMENQTWGKPSAFWAYRDENGSVIYYVARYDKDGEKSYLPWSYIGNGQWAAKAFPAPRPLYGLELLKQRPDANVMIVEGEKAADAARRIRGANYVVLTWSNGSKAWEKADFSVLFGRNRVVLIPDADAPGIAAMEGIAALLHGNVKEVKILDVSGQPKGWDLADEPEWDWAKFKEWAVPLTKLWIPPEPPDVKPEVVPPVIIDQSKHLTVNIGDVEDEIVVTETLRERWNKCSLALSDTGKPILDQNNIVRVLLTDERMKSNFWWDEFHKKFFLQKGKEIRELSDLDVLLITNYLQDQYGLRRLSDEVVFKALKTYAANRRRNEPRDWMETLVWDQKPRLDKILIDYFGCEDTDYNRVVGKNFLLSIVARIYLPGCKADNMVIYEGPQGRFKSTALSILGGKFYTESNESVASKDFSLVLQGKFLIEISELDAFSKAEASTIKKVLSNQNDRFRAPYGRLPEDFPRQCVFAGTTNEHYYLRDHTGARRFFPVKIGFIKTEPLRADRDQLYAEAVSRFKGGEDWYWVPVELADAEQESRRQVDEWEQLVADYVKDRDKFTLFDVALNALNIEKSKLDSMAQRRIAFALTRLGFIRRTIRDVYGELKKGWVKQTPSLLDAIKGDDSY